MPSQKAIVVPSQGAQYTLVSRPVPTPGPGDVLVKIEGVGLNPAEWKSRKINFAEWLGKEYPIMLGTDGAGTVVDVGDGVQGVVKGDRVVFQGWFDDDRSTHQEYVLVYADLLAKLPASISSLEASSIPLALATAALGLALPYNEKDRGGAGIKAFWDDDAKGYYAGRPIAVLGGASACGQFAIQIAAYQGFSPIITTASLHNAEHLRSIGVTHVVDRHADVTKEVAAIVAGAAGTLELVYDAVNTPITQTEVDLLAPGGTVFSIWELPEGLVLKEGRRAIACYGSVHMYKDVGRAMYKKLGEFLEKGIIKPTRVEKLSGGLTGVAGGLERMEKNQVSGVKLVVDPSETP